MGIDMEERIIINQYNKPIACKKCNGRMIFKGVGEYECEECKEIAFDDYGIVRNYVEQHRGATTAEISARTGVSQREINEMVREERFYVSADSRSFLACEGCGVEIRTGRYCPTCKKLKEAAESRRIRDDEIELHKKNLSGVAIEDKETAKGERRFKLDEE